MKRVVVRTTNDKEATYVVILSDVVVKRVVAEGQYGPPALLEPYSGLEFLGDCFAGAWLVRSPGEQ